MKTDAAPRRRLRIDRLELDLRGVPPATAEAAVRALGPALARALAPHEVRPRPAERIDAGRVETTAAPATHELAAGIAQRIAGSIGRKRP